MSIGGVLFGRDAWDPVTIIAQIVAVQCLYYLSLGLLFKLIVGEAAGCGGGRLGGEQRSLLSRSLTAAASAWPRRCLATRFRAASYYCLWCSSRRCAARTQLATLCHGTCP